MARKHGWYLKEKRKGIVDYVLVPSYDTAWVPALMFFLMKPYWVALMECQRCLPACICHIYGFTILALCWMVNVHPWHIQKNWDRVSDQTKLYTKILESNTHQLLKSIKSLFAIGPLTTAICRDSSRLMTQTILDGTVDIHFISNVDHSTEMRHFIQALKIPLSKKTGKSLPPFEYSLDTDTYKKYSRKLQNLRLLLHQAYITDTIQRHWKTILLRQLMLFL